MGDAEDTRRGEELGSESGRGGRNKSRITRIHNWKLEVALFISSTPSVQSLPTLFPFAIWAPSALAAGGLV